MNHGESARILAKVADGIVAGKNHPAAVDLKLDELRIGIFQDQVIARLPATHIIKLEVMIVIGELQPGTLSSLANPVGQLDGSLGLIQSDAGAENVLGRIRAQYSRAHDRADGELRAKRMSLVEGPIQISRIELQMSAGTNEPGLIQQTAKLLSRQTPVPGGLHLHVTDFPQPLQRSASIGPHGIVDRIELDSRTLPQRIGGGSG